MRNAELKAKTPHTADVDSAFRTPHSAFETPHSAFEQGTSAGKSTAPDSIPGAPPPEFKIDTVRVETRLLDTLMTQLGELGITRIRIAQRPAEIEEAVNLWEEINRSNAEWRMRNAELKAKTPRRNGECGVRNAELKAKTPQRNGEWDANGIKGKDATAEWRMRRRMRN